MKCPTCDRRASWARTRCPACKTKLIAWYVIAVIIFLAVCGGGLLLLERMG